MAAAQPPSKLETQQLRSSPVKESNANYPSLPQSSSTHPKVPPKPQRKAGASSVPPTQRDAPSDSILPPVVPPRRTGCDTSNACIPPAIPPRRSSVRPHSVGKQDFASIVQKSDNPPKPRPRTRRQRTLGFTPLSMPASPHKVDNTSLKSKCISEPLSLIEFERKYSNQLPLQIMVLQGYQGQSPELSISTSDTYNIHFKKYRDVVAVRDNKGHIYSIPMGSALEFVLLNRPVGGNAKTTITTFEKVSDIPAHSTCPKVICATTPWSSTSDPKVSVEEGEVLVVKKPRLYGEKTLEVFSLTSKSAKVLPSNCKGSFSTDPSLTRLHLLDIVEHIPDVLPCEANLYVGDSDQELLPFCSGTLLLLAKMREASLVASNVPCESEQISQPPILLDIPLDDSFTEVEVVVIGSCNQSLYENTRKIIDNFATANVTSFKGSATQQTYETQSLLYETLREGYAHLGVELTDPELLYCGTSPTSTATEAAPSISPHQSSHFSSSKVDSEGYEIIDILDSSLHATLTETSSLPIPAPCHKVDRCHPPSHHQRAGSLLSPSSHGTTDQKQRPKASTRKGRKGNATPGRRLGSRPLPGNKTERLHDEAQELKTTVGTHASATPSVEFSRNMNRRYVATLSEDQTLQILDSMGLSDYRKAFSERGVTGNILLNFDDTSLETELGINIKLHRIRLMKIISGSHSARALIEQ